MDLSQSLAEILVGSDGSRINTVANILKDGGVGTADDLKYFDWNSLKDLGGLSNMEVNKIMRYIQEKFPEEYQEHKRKRTEERKLQNEVEILNFKAEHEKKLQQQKMELEKEMEKILKKRQEVEEQLKRSQEQSGASKDKASSWTETPMQCWKDFKKYVTKSESTDFHENNAKQKKKFKGPKGPSKYENIEEVISEIFAGFSNEARINQIKQILHEDVITSADELSCFDWKSLEDLGLTSSEAARIMDFVKEKAPKVLNLLEFSKDYKKQKKTRTGETQTEEEMMRVKMSIDETIADIFTLFPSLSKKFIAEYLKNHCLVEELKQYDDKSMQAMRSLEAEVNEIMNYIKKKFPIDGGKNLKTGIQDDGFKRIELSTEEAVAKILEGCNSSRLIFVTRMLMEEGAQNSKELKSFNRNSLEGLGVLEKEEIDKFLKFIQES